jgi:L-ascorbate metabolism protein UlaG (beta-lactamase superfamily)
MRLTHLGHACLLVKAAGVRVLIDPGTYSADFSQLTGLDAVLFTHQHPDHLDPDRLRTLLAANSDATVIAEAGAVDVLADVSPGATDRAFAAADQARIGGLTVTGVGDRHAFIHDGLPRIGNTGYVLSADAEPTLFHPGDAYDADPGRAVDVLALPLSAPWTAIRDTLEFVRRLAPRWVVPVHDALLSRIGREFYLTHVRRFGAEEATVADLADGKPWDVPLDVG